MNVVFLTQLSKMKRNGRNLHNGSYVKSIVDPIAWAAFHSSAQAPRNFDVTIKSLLPLFPDDSRPGAMIRHSMDVIKRAVEHLNPGQVPVLTVDQTLFAIAKIIQWI